jgi:hypothetical protein
MDIHKGETVVRSAEPAFCGAAKTETPQIRHLKRSSFVWAHTQGKIRLAMLVTNILVTALGVIMFIIGFASLMVTEGWRPLGITRFTTLPVIIMVLSALLTMVSAIGITGARFANTCLLTAYIFILGIPPLFEIAIAGYSVGAYDHFGKLIDYAWTQSSNYTRSNVQADFGCCGFYNVTDRTAYDGQCSFTVLYGSAGDGSALSTVPCAIPLTTAVENNVSVFATSVMLVACFQLTMAVVAFMLRNRAMLAESTFSELKRSGYIVEKATLLDEFGLRSDEDGDKIF